MTQLVDNTRKQILRLFSVVLAVGYVVGVCSLFWQQVNTQQTLLNSLSLAFNQQVVDGVEVDTMRDNLVHSPVLAIWQGGNNIYQSNNASITAFVNEYQLSDNLMVVMEPYAWQVLTSAPFWFMSFVFFSSFGFLRQYSKSFWAKTLKDINEIEHWADQAIVQGNYSSVSTDHPIGYAINHLRKSMLHAQNQDSMFDKALKESALLDDETGIGNKTYFNSRLSAQLVEEESRGAVFIIQCQGCDTIHSLYGDEQAFHVIEMVIQAVEKHFENGTQYYLARCQEYELALLVPSIYVKEAEKIADRIITSLQKLTLPIGINSEDFCHVGLSYFKAGDKPFQIMAEADMALRTAQLQGPSQWFMFDPGEIAQESAKGSLKWRTFLENAIRHNSFVIFFQPVIERFSDNILHHEVLSKVRDEKGELISARVFLPMAKKCGLSSAVDLLVLNQVCKLLTYEQDKQDCCSVNVSVDSLLDKTFIEQLTKTLKENQAVAHRLIIEVSEYQLVNHLTTLKPVLFQLTLLGVQLLADKVGQYVVSAHYLKQLPIRYVKLHRSIVMNIDQKPENQVFVQSMKILCEPLKVKMYALGVEDQNEWRVLTKLGVQGGQGHFFTEPIAQVAKAIGH